FKVETVNRTDFSARLYISATQQDLFEGLARKHVRLTGRGQGIHDNGGFADYLRREGYHGLVDIDRVHGGITRAPPVDPAGWLAGFRQIITEWLNSKQERWPLTVSFLKTLALGEKNALGLRLNSYLRRLGIIHLFVISGLHVGFVSWFVLYMFDKYSNTVKFVVITFFLLLYLLFLGWPLPALRAGLMVWLGVLALWLERKTGGWSLLISAVFILVLLNPFVIFSAGFQLSVSAVAGIFFVAPYTRVVPWGFLRLFVYNLGAFFGVLPAVIYHFNYFPRLGFIFSFLAGIIFIPFIFLLLLQVPFLLVNWTFFADNIEWLFFQVEQGIVYLIRWLEPLAGTPGAELWTVIGLTGGIVLILDVRVNRYLKIVGYIMVAILFIYILLPRQAPHLEVNTAGDISFTHLHQRNRDYLILPRRTRFDPYQWRQIEIHMAAKNVFRLDGLISDYPAGYFRQVETELFIGNYYPYWRNKGLLEEEKFVYDFDSHRLHSPYGMIRYNYPPAMDETYDPSLLVGIFADDTVLINKLEDISRLNYNKLLESDYRLHLLEKRKLRVPPVSKELKK
ncbi:MAG: ComEC/Rec2 family competence protein, partial [bacterium]